MRVLKFTLLITIYIGLASVSYSQSENETFRKCYIIAYQSKNDFLRAESGSCIRKTLKDWFNNQVAECKPNDSKGVVPADFFNPEEDEILFYDFGLYRDGYSYYYHYPESDTSAFFSAFADNFLRLHSRFSQEQESADDFLDKCFDNCHKSIRDRGYFTEMVSMSNYVFPLLFAKLPKKIYAQEYYVLQLSDFTNRSEIGTAYDYQQLQQVMRSKATLLRDNFIDPLEANLGKMEKFYYSYTGSRPIFIYCYTPKEILYPTSKDVKFEQIEYGKDNYRKDVVNIEFRHNEQLVVNKLAEEIFAVKDNQTIPVSSRLIIEPAPEPKKQKDENVKLYTIDVDVIELATVVRDKDFDNLEAVYTFYAKQHLLNVPDCNIGYVRIASDDILLSDIVFRENPADLLRNKLWNLARIVVPLVIFITLLLLGIAIYRGRVKRFKVTVIGYTEKLYKEIKDCTTKEHDYYTWKENDKKDINLTVTITPEYKRWFKIKWGCRLNLKGTDIEELKNTGLEVRIHNGREKGEILGDDFFPDKIGGKFKYGIRITPTVNTKWDFEGQRYIFTLRTYFYEVKHTFLGLSHKKRIPYDDDLYKFEIGKKEFGTIWSGFDPGTTGASVAFGRTQHDIYLSKVEDSNKESGLSEINSSVIAFEKKLQENTYEGWRPGIDYLYGNDAAGATYLKDYFCSMKKTLGYDLDFPIRVDGKELFQLKGEQIFSLQIRGMYKDLQRYLQKEGNGYLSKKEKAELFENEEEYIPRRVVVAVPNSFNNYRTQAMIDSIVSCGKFEEIITVYEPEAVLFYCIKEGIVKANSKVLIFDMGGATINATFFDYQYKKPKYIIDTLGRIGYGIGGDTIDFCIINAILAMSAVRDALSIVDDNGANEYRDNNANKLIKLALKIKEDIVADYESDMAYLIDAYFLQELIYSTLGVTIDITHETDEFQEWFGNAGQYFFDTFIEPVVYKNIRDAIKELTAFNEVSACEFSLIFSGRSTAFPFVKEHVIKALQEQGFNKGQVKKIDEDNSLDKLKTVVAEGACFYGISREYIELVNNKSFYSFVLKRHKAFDKDSIEYKTFIARGEKKKKIKIRGFNKIGNNKYEYSGATKDRYDMGLCKTIPIKENEDPKFINDGQRADIYQVTGNNPQEVFNEQKKHKITYLTSLNAKGGITELELEMQPNDNIFCIARYDSNPDQDEIKKANVESRDIGDENDEHYIFALKNNS